MARYTASDEGFSLVCHCFLYAAIRESNKDITNLPFPFLTLHSSMYLQRTHALCTNFQKLQCFVPMDFPENAVVSVIPRGQAYLLIHMLVGVPRNCVFLETAGHTQYIIPYYIWGILIFIVSQKGAHGRYTSVRA